MSMTVRQYVDKHGKNSVKGLKAKAYGCPDDLTIIKYYAGNAYYLNESNGLKYEASGGSLIVE